MRLKNIQILTIVGAMTLVYVLFQLPTSVLETTNTQENINKKTYWKKVFLLKRD